MATNKPAPGQSLVRYRAIADLVGGQLKRDIIREIQRPFGYSPALALLRKLAHAVEKEAYRLAREIATDLLEMTEVEVENKPYRYQLEIFYYARPEDVPDDPHWEIIPLITRKEKAEDDKMEDEGERNGTVE